MNPPSPPDRSTPQILLYVALALLLIFILVPAGVNSLDALGVIARESDNQIEVTITALEDRPDLGAEDLNPAEVLYRAEAAAADAEDLNSQLDMLLSFLQGASVLVGLALGAAAYFGFSGQQSLREELDKRIADYERLRVELETESKTIDKHRADLERLPDQLNHIDQLQTIFHNLLQASQELRLRNYHEAYRAAQDVLAIDPHNLEALYMAGWIEIQYTDALDNAIDHLRLALSKKTDWPAARAAYGLALRRKATKLSGPERDKLFTQAEGMFKQALGVNPDLVDLNLESFWGPVGGMKRDMDQLDEAIRAYERARDVTPGSSYPLGNLAALYLQQARRDSNPAIAERSLDMFEDVRSLAMAKLAITPNDYYHLMDIAMAMTVLTRRDPGLDAEAQRRMDAAIKLNAATISMLETSLRGWVHVQQNCPDDWSETRQRIDAMIVQVRAAIDHRQQRATPAPDSGPSTSPEAPIDAAAGKG